MKILNLFLEIFCYPFVNRKKCISSFGCRITKKSFFEGNNFIGFNTWFDGKLGYASYIGSNAHISADVGKYCCIASNVKSINGFHPVKDHVSIHPAFLGNNCTKLCFSKDDDFAQYRYADAINKYDIVIGNDVWIGFGAILMAGITLHDGSVIAAGSVVTNDVPPYTIYGGNPARQIRKRFTDNEICFLLKEKWWNKEVSWIKNNADVFMNIDNYITKTLRSEHK